MIKLLSVGNSFSRNAHTYLNAISRVAGNEIHTVNLYIGGCSLQRHIENMKTGAVAYQLDVDGINNVGSASLLSGLEMDKWDFITLQQASGYSGEPESFVPDITVLRDYINEKCIGAQILLHQTWAYEKDSDHGSFVKYGSSRDEMHRRICSTYKMASKLTGAGIVPVGETVHLARNSIKELNYPEGMSLCSDGFHLNSYGCLLAGFTFYRFLTGEDAPLYVPEGMDTELCDKLVKLVNGYFSVQ